MEEVEIVRHPQIEGISLFFVTVDYRTLHNHPEFELLWVMDGAMTMSGAQVDCAVYPGDLVIMNPHQSHKMQKISESCTFLCFQVAPDFLKKGFPNIKKVYFDTAKPFGVLSAADKDDIVKMLFEVTRAYLRKNDCYELECIGMVHLIFHKLLQSAAWHYVTEEEASERQRRNERLNRLLTFVDENYMHKIRLSDFAMQEGLSMGYLSHFVKDTLNQSFQEYVNTARFNCACKLIAEGNRRLLDVCMESGFSDYRYFSKNFVERTGKTPEAYRRSLMPNTTEEIRTHHSVHSLERFYSRESSIRMLEKYEDEYVKLV